MSFSQHSLSCTALESDNPHIPVSNAMDILRVMLGWLLQQGGIRLPEEDTTSLTQTKSIHFEMKLLLFPNYLVPYWVTKLDSFCFGQEWRESFMFRRWLQIYVGIMMHQAQRKKGSIFIDNSYANSTRKISIFLIKKFHLIIELVTNMCSWVLFSLFILWMMAYKNKKMCLTLWVVSLVTLQQYLMGGEEVNGHICHTCIDPMKWNR